MRAKKTIQKKSPYTLIRVNEDKVHQCDVCKKSNATLQNEDDTWICENCAQYMSDLGNEIN